MSRSPRMTMRKLRCRCGRRPRRPAPAARPGSMKRRSVSGVVQGGVDLRGGGGQDALDDEALGGFVRHGSDLSMRRAPAGIGKGEEGGLQRFTGRMQHRDARLFARTTSSVNPVVEHRLQIAGASLSVAAAALCYLAWRNDLRHQYRAGRGRWHHQSIRWRPVPSTTACRPSSVGALAFSASRTACSAVRPRPRTSCRTSGCDGIPPIAASSGTRRHSSRPRRAVRRALPPSIYRYVGMSGRPRARAPVSRDGRLLGHGWHVHPIGPWVRQPVARSPRTSSAPRLAGEPGVRHEDRGHRRQRAHRDEAREQPSSAGP